MIGASTAPDRLGLSDCRVVGRHERDTHMISGKLFSLTEETTYSWYVMRALSETH